MPHTDMDYRAEYDLAAVSHVVPERMYGINGEPPTVAAQHTARILDQLSAECGA